MNYHNFTNEQIVDKLKQVNFVKTHAAKALGMTVQNLYYLLKNKEGLKELFDDATEERLDIAESALFELVKKKHFPAIKFTLETLGRSRGYGNNIEVTHVDESSQILKAIERKYVNDI